VMALLIVLVATGACAMTSILSCPANIGGAGLAAMASVKACCAEIVPPGAGGA
jgi:hypothetical protein